MEGHIQKTDYERDEEIKELFERIEKLEKKAHVHDVGNY
jgi:hypothetical protein